ncbi:MAG: response regulator [Clostridia bacterium]|nr:response regulator [Deltaproteobacteria bacterium]
MPKILVVDDDRAVQTMLVDLLEERGYEVDTARNGRHAMERLRQASFDLLLLDVLIPHINGFQLLEQIRGTTDLTELPVIMMSGIYRARNHRSDMADRFNVFEYLDKPLQPALLLGLLEQAVGPGKEKKRHTVPNSEPAPHRERSSAEPLSLREERLVEPEAREEKAEVEQSAREEFKQSAFLLQGSIKRTPVASVLGKLWRQKETGALLLRNEKIKKIIQVVEGEVVSVRSNLVSECLGRLLVRERLISAEQCAESVSRMKDQGKRQGEILVGMNVITDRNLAYGLELQLETKVFDVFLWHGGEYRFNSTITPEHVDDVALEWRGGALVVEGIRRAFDETRLRGLMVPILDVPLTFRDDSIDLRGLRFNKKELEALKQVRSGRTTRDLLGTMPMDPPDALRVIYSLIALDLVVPAT